MTVKEFYDEISGDYEGVMSRFPSESFTLKFIIRFLDDTSFNDLCSSLEIRDYKEAFRAAHNLKGLGLSLGFTCLGRSGSDMADALRGDDIVIENLDNLDKLLMKVREDYNKTIEVIKRLKG